MAETETEAPESAPQAEAPPEAPSGEGGTEKRLDSLESKMEQLLDFLKGGAGISRPEPEAPDMKAQMRDAVREVQAADKAKATRAEAEESLRERIAHLEHMAEVKPVEYNAHTKALWQPDKP